MIKKEEELDRWKWVGNNNDKSNVNNWWVGKKNKSIEKESEEERIVLYL